MEQKKQLTDILTSLMKYKYSDQELQKLLKLLNTDDKKELFYNEMEQLWQKYANKNTQYQIDTEKALEQTLLKIREIEHTEDVKVSTSLNWFSRHPNTSLLFKIAAVFLLAVILFTGGYWGLRVLNHKETAFITIHVPYGQKKIIVLSDCTKVWINSGSTFQYPLHFNNNRTVHLSGEAYFEVTKDPIHPFIVTTPTIKVKVLGTGFDVFAYPDEALVKTTLVHGKVAVYPNFSKEITKKSILLPGEQYILYRRSNTFDIIKVNPDIYTTWRQNKLIFMDTPLKEVIKQLERWYNVKININDPVVEQFSCTVSFTREPLQKILNVLQDIIPIRITHSGHNIFITRDKKRWNNFLKNKIKT